MSVVVLTSNIELHVETRRDSLGRNGESILPTFLSSRCTHARHQICMYQELYISQTFAAALLLVDPVPIKRSPSLSLSMLINSTLARVHISFSSPRQCA